jgi:hypothetical protein
MAFVSGKRMRFKVGSTNIPCKRWRANLRGAAVETTSGESGGAETFIGGITGGDVTALLSYDDVLQYVAMVNPNASYAVELYPDSATTGAKISGSLFVESAEVISELKDQTMIEVKGKFNGGAFTTAM